MIAIITENKNQQLLLKAANKLIVEKEKPVQIFLVGAGEINILKRLAKELKIEDYIYFIRFTDKIAEILYHSNIKILTSKEEAFGIVLLEAALLKKPIISSDKTGSRNIIKHKKTGLLFKNNDVNDLVKKIERLLNNPILGKTLGENAFQFVKKHFITQKSFSRLEKFYKKILSD